MRSLRLLGLREGKEAFALSGIDISSCQMSYTLQTISSLDRKVMHSYRSADPGEAFVDFALIDAVIA